jgi:membrane protein YqaA with SNARE-associated domain
LKAIVLHLGVFFASLGGVGLLLLGCLDSSFLLFLPLGNDLLLVGLTAHNPSHLPYYVFMATAGSLLGSLFTDWVSRKGGEEGLEKRVSKRRLGYVQAQVKKRGGFALALASLMPPPFPFTPFVIVAAALKYPRARLLGVIAIGRIIRFSVEGLLAQRFGSRILAQAETPLVQGIVIGIVVLSVGGSAYSLYDWAKRSKRARV